MRDRAGVQNGRVPLTGEIRGTAEMENTDCDRKKIGNELLPGSGGKGRNAE